MSGIRVAIFRGRFQPFTRVHYDCVKGFYYRYASQINPDAVAKDPNAEEQPILVLCVVRDLENQAAAANLLRKRTVPNNCFRHLYFFNPLTSLECERDARLSLAYFLANDKHLNEPQQSDVKKQFQRFLFERLMIQSIPVKFPELVASVKTEADMKKVIDDSTSDLSSCLTPTNSTGPPHSAEATGVLKSIVTLIVIHAQEAIHHDGLSEIGWFLPVFDRGDVYDFNLLKRSVVAPDTQILLASHPEMDMQYSGQSSLVFLPTISNIDDPEPLPHYGVFVYYAYLVLSNAFNDADVYEETKLIKEFVIHNQLTVDRVFQNFSRKVYDIRSKLYENPLPEVEKDLLEDSNRFMEQARKWLAVPHRAVIDKMLEKNKYKLEPLLGMDSSATIGFLLANYDFTKAYEILDYLNQKRPVEVKTIRSFINRCKGNEYRAPLPEEKNALDAISKIVDEDTLFEAETLARSAAQT